MSNKIDYQQLISDICGEFADTLSHHLDSLRREQLVLIISYIFQDQDVTSGVSLTTHDLGDAAIHLICTKIDRIQDEFDEREREAEYKNASKIVEAYEAGSAAS